MNVIRGKHLIKIFLVLIVIIFLSIAILHRKNSLKLKDKGYLNWFMKERNLDIHFEKKVKISVGENNEFRDEFIKGYDDYRDGILPIYNNSKINNSFEHEFLGKLSNSKQTATWRNKWNGENRVLFNNNEVIFSEKYRQLMKSKSNHSLHNYLPFEERNKNIEKYCSFGGKDFKNSNSLGITGRRIVFVDKFELLACNIPKASSTTITQIFMRMDQGLSDNEKPNGPMGYKVNISMSNKPSENSNLNAQRLQTYTKIILTRHPFSLIGSKYHFKVSNTAEDRFQIETCPEIIKKLYLNGLPTDEDYFIRNRRGTYAYLNDTEFNQKLIQIRRLKAGPGKYNITLLEYIWTILNNKQNEKLSNSGQTLICNPCAVRYDVILHYSNVYEEANIVLDYIQRDLPYAKRVHYPDHSPRVSQNRCNEEFSQIPMEIRRKLYDFFKLDFLLFGYHFEDNPQNQNACY